jgi:pimeloyl-ACP methyl ester carboxylesterase
MPRLIALSLLFFVNLNLGVAEELVGHWEGSIVMRGVSWPVEMDFENNNSEVAAKLSIRSMGMVANPVEIANPSTDAPTFSFPFGIGEFELNPGHGLILSHRKLKSGRRITLLLERIENYEPPYQMEDVTIPNGEEPLKGTMYVPNDNTQPTAGVVILHGSGPGGRDSWEYRSWADYYARLGIATLIYDKRAYDEVYPDLSVLADDAKAVLTYFQNRPGIQNNAVGFSGGSQAAWLATSVASQPESKVAFIIMSGWPAVTPGEQELQSKENKLRAAGLTSSELRDALAYLNLYFYVAQTGQLWDELSTAAKTAATTNWSELVPIPNHKT